ncbi:zinc-binding dehydrogenase [Micromonospora sp. NPDC049230]|uniref:zinc-binding dehydrogenase n=1 Tax=Micromonospora sp. NPDC049230 TaxID=3155502 RepID=UPI0034090803
MQAIVAAPDTRAGFRVTDLPDPTPGPGQVLVEVRHVGVNAGEIRHLDVWPAGAVLGHDAAGHVVDGGVDGAGLREGDRVVAFGPGAWARLAVFDVDSVAVVPAGVDLAEMAVLPTVGLTALRTLRTSGPLLGRRVLVTGASGGVGRVAVQLARHGGAYVVAVVGSPARGAGLADLGADEVVVGLDAITDPVDVVLETVGGAPGSDLGLLTGLVARGALRAPIGWRGSWQRLEEAADALRERRVSGKILLELD